MPPCFDVYVWVRTADRASVLATFVDRYVDKEDPGEPRFEAFVRAPIEERPTTEDLDALAELRSPADGAQLVRHRGR